MTTTAASIAAAIYQNGFSHAATLTPALRATATRVAIEIAELVTEGDIPATAASWGELDSYMDANDLGDCGDQEMDFDDWSLVMATIDAWLAELPFTDGVAPVTVGDRVVWGDTAHKIDGGGTVAAVDGGTVIVTTDDDVPMAFGTVHPRADILRAYPDLGDVTGSLAELFVVNTAPLTALLPELPVIEPAPLDTAPVAEATPADSTVIHIEWTETVTHRTALTLPELRAGLAAALAEDPNEERESLAFYATADAASMTGILDECDAMGPCGGFLARRNGRDAVKVTGREIVALRVG